ncbi:hypothetical protein [Bacillus tropicus]|uniref:hypothetical protein n=1 Tax=Bacillus tropicus TaxID=2026188 RepID=UPI0023AFAE4B|nr:hypothetical protein [Bacillus tropicus]
MTEYEMSELMNFVSQSMNQMLSTGEQVIEILNKYGFVVSISTQDGYFQGALFELRRCVISNGNIDLHDPPLIIGQRHFFEMEDFQSFIDEEALEELDEIDVQAALYIGGLIRSINIQKNEEVQNQTDYRLPELSAHEEKQIVDTLKNCLRDAMSNHENSFGKIEDLDLLFMSYHKNNETTFMMYKLSDCVLLGEEYPVELPQNPIYVAALDQRNGFNSTANSDFKNTSYEKYCYFVNDCLASSVKTR